MSDEQVSSAAARVEVMLRFLMVDEDPLVARLLVREFSRHGRAESVATPSAARRALASKTFHALIADVTLDDGDGLQLLREVRKRDTLMEVAIVAGGVDKEVLEAAHRLDATCLLKPVHVADLRLIAQRARRRVQRRMTRIGAQVEEWGRRHSLSEAEMSILALAAHGTRRASLPGIRNVEKDTLRKQVRRIVERTGDDTLDHAVARLLREIVDGQ